MTENKTPLVVVGVDDSADSMAALRWADRYCQATGASLRVVVAWQWAVAYGYPMTFEGYNPAADAARVAEKAVTELSLPRERVTTVVPEGGAGEELVKASDDADLLVVGSHGHRAVASVLIGSVSNYCVHHAKVPVIVVR
jgi:nucleotide-binding universal stress UspA family protein